MYFHILHFSIFEIFVLLIEQIFSKVKFFVFVLSGLIGLKTVTSTALVKQKNPN